MEAVMRFQLLFLAAGIVGVSAAQAQGLGKPAAPAKAVQVTCSPGEKQLSRLNAEYIEFRSGSSSRSVPVAEISEIDVTGPVNRANKFAWATVRINGSDPQSVGLVLPNAGTLVLDGVGAQGKPDSIDVLDCKHITFKSGT
jgi:hypothetical protein